MTELLKVDVLCGRFNVYVAQPEVKPGCVLRRSNVNVLESRKLVDNDQVPWTRNVKTPMSAADLSNVVQFCFFALQVNACKRNMNTFAFVGDLANHPEVSCVYHSEDAENAFLKDPRQVALKSSRKAPVLNLT